MKKLQKLTISLVVTSSLFSLQSCIMEPVDDYFTKKLFDESKWSYGVSIEDPYDITENSFSVVGRCTSLSDIKEWGITLYYNDTIDVASLAKSSDETEIDVTCNNLYPGLKYSVGAYVVLNDDNSTCIPSKPKEFATLGIHNPFIKYEKGNYTYNGYEKGRYKYILNFKFTISSDIPLYRVAKAGLKFYGDGYVSTYTRDNLQSRSLEISLSYSPKERGSQITISPYIEMRDKIFEEGDKLSFTIE